MAGRVLFVYAGALRKAISSHVWRREGSRVVGRKKVKAGAPPSARFTTKDPQLPLLSFHLDLLVG